MPETHDTDVIMQEYLSKLRSEYANVDMVETAKQAVRSLLERGMKAAVAAGELPGAPLPPYVVETPADPKNGDFAANLAMVGAKTLKLPPRKIAETVVAHLPRPNFAERVEVAGPGFINLYLGSAWFSDVVKAAVACGGDYGRTDAGGGQKVNVEFVSANPTGPMHLGNARGGALGDVLAEALAWAGYDVTREFYINDAGNQVAKFGRSLAARYLQLVRGEDAVEFPEDGYQGDDIRQRAREFLDAEGPAWADRPQEALEAALVDYALPRNIQGLKDDLAKYRIHYDVWFPESRLHENGAVAAVVKRLGERGATYEKDGAVWYRDPGGEVEKDEVLVRTGGVPTYFAADIAYHADKFSRGFETLIDVWGADHHGHVARMKGAMAALGYNGNALDIVLMQFVRLMRDGQQVKMSKRTGKAITLTDLLDEVPIDSARFFFNMREPGSTIDFDLDLAVAEDSDNPVYYVQYAHARICSVLKNLSAEGICFDAQAAFGSLQMLKAEPERALIRHIAAFPGDIAGAAEGRDPARITRALVELATGFHRFYTACRIKGEQPGLMQARLALAVAAKTVLENGLGMLKVSAPDRM